MINKIESIWCSFYNWSEPYNQYDDNTDVIFTLTDGTKWVATFFTYNNIISLRDKNKQTGECLNGLYFCATDMILIEEISEESITKVLEDIIKEDRINLHCTQIYE